MSEHTPTPWRNNSHDITGGDYDYILTAHSKMRDLMIENVPELAEAKANVEFIVRACNAHEELLAAAKELVAIRDGGSVSTIRVRVEEAIDKLREAITKAEGDKEEAESELKSGG